MKIVAMVLAGGEGTRLYPLTAEHAKPALPFANGYRIIDFVLSNLLNSGISNIYVLAQYKPESLVQHIAQAWTPALEDCGGSIKVARKSKSLPHLRECLALATLPEGCSIKAYARSPKSPPSVT